jgi:hypothetical protein
MDPSVNVVQELNERKTIGRVEPFGSNNTRYITIRPDQMLEWVDHVYQQYSHREWVTLAVTPNYPVAVYPTEERPAACETGIALAPGLKPSELEDM